MQLRSAKEQIEALTAGHLTSSELVETIITHVEATDPAINAVVVRDFERARQAARSADRARRAGDRRALLGLPITVKEAFDVEGLATTWGLEGYPERAAADAVVVERLRAAGAIVLGKTNVATMLSDWQTANPVFGVTKNPWDATRTPGGSSGGGAAAVATGMTFLDVGSDLAGSLRIPAAFCGVYAHRPSHGIVPMRGFAPPMAPRTPIAQPIDQSTLGPIARSASDLKLALDVIAGADTPDSAGWRLSLPPARHESFKACRVLVLDEHPLVATAQSIRNALGKLADELENVGCTVGRSPDEIPDMKDLTRTFSALLMSLMGIDMPDDEYSSLAAGASTERGSAQDHSMTMSYRDWSLLDRHRLALAATWRETFARWDVVLCPAAPATAFAHDGRPFDKRKIDVDGAQIVYQKLPFWAALATPNGLPVTTVPIGRDTFGLPIGVQIVGPRLEDYTPLAFARLLETELSYRFTVPELVEPRKTCA